MPTAVGMGRFLRRFESRKVVSRVAEYPFTRKLNRITDAWPLNRDAGNRESPRLSQLGPLNPLPADQETGSELNRVEN
jgi:hypothetical protein